MGYTNPVFVLTVYSPGLVGLFMVWRHYGPAWLRSFYRFTVADVHGLVTLLLGMPAVFYGLFTIEGVIGSDASGLQRDRAM
jgi:hypothetical protein